MPHKHTAATPRAGKVQTMGKSARIELIAEIQSLRAKAGGPSLRIIASGSGCSHTTIAKLLSPEQPLPTWGRVEAVAAHLKGNIDHMRSLWVTAKAEERSALLGPEGNAAEAARPLAFSPYTPRSLTWDYALLAVLSTLLIAIITLNGLLPSEKGWPVSYVSQFGFYTLASIVTAFKYYRKSYRPDASKAMLFICVSAFLTAAAEILQLILLIIETSIEMTYLYDALYLSTRVCLIFSLFAYVKARSAISFQGWARLLLGWTPILWICSLAACYLLMSIPLPSATRLEIVQLIVNTFYFTLDIALGVIALIVLFKYTSHRFPPFALFMVSVSLWISDIAWNLIGPDQHRIPAAVSNGYIVGGYGLVLIATHNSLFRASTKSREAIVFETTQAARQSNDFFPPRQGSAGGNWRNEGGPAQSIAPQRSRPPAGV